MSLPVTLCPREYDCGSNIVRSTLCGIQTHAPFSQDETSDSSNLVGMYNITVLFPFIPSLSCVVLALYRMYHLPEEVYYNRMQMHHLAIFYYTIFYEYASGDDFIDF